jgi:Tol biopolymer transport system component
MSNGGTGDYNIYVGAVGARDRAIARSSAKDGYASWSPNTNEMAFVSGRSGNGDIYAVNLSSQKLVRISDTDDFDVFPEWTPDGNGIVYCSGDAMNHNIVMVRRKGKNSRWSEPVPLTRGKRDELRPVVSPDGQLVAFYGRDEGSVENDAPIWNIHVLPIESTDIGDDELAASVVAKDVVIDLNTGPAWTPDSRKIVYVKRDPADFNPIYGYDLYSGRAYLFKTETKMNRDILMSRLGVLSFRAQVGAWDKVYIALTNQGLQLQTASAPRARVNYLAKGSTERDRL